MNARVLAGLALLLGAGGCRDGIGSFVPDVTRPADEPVVRLTYAAGDQRYPAWSADGDSVYYSGDTFPGMPATPGGVYAVPAGGGTARAVMPELQSFANGGPRRLAAPSPAPTGTRIALVELVRPAAPGPSCGCELPEPRLVSGWIRVRDTGEAGAPDDDLTATVNFAGRDPRTTPPAPGSYLDRVFPFQLRFAEEGVVAMRPSWSPDGERLVFSDGLQLYVWRVGMAPPQPLPGTADGVLPAWSPDGQRIAFTRWARTDSTSGTCACPTLRGTAFFEQIAYVANPQVWTIAPDGSDPVSLGPGDAPAWAPDGQSLYLRRDDRIVRVALDASVLGIVPFTEGAHDPALSPDGTRLAFARDGSGYDVWVVTLDF